MVPDGTDSSTSARVLLSSDVYDKSAGEVLISMHLAQTCFLSELDCCNSVFAGLANNRVRTFIYLFIQFISPQLERVKTICTK